MTTTPNTTASGAANAGLHALADRIEEAQGRAICISVESADYLREALAASAPVAPTMMVDMVPPATSRDRWMYEQGRLAERDPRTSRAAPVAPPQPMLVLNGYQLRGALDFVAPDGTDDQLDNEVCIQHGPERTHDEGTEAAGMYCWLSDYPEEGSIRLDDEATTEAAPVAPAPQPAVLTADQKEYLDQAQTMLEDYAEILDRAGNNSTAKGAEASAHVIRGMLAAAPKAAPAINKVSDIIDAYGMTPGQPERVADIPGLAEALEAAFADGSAQVTSCDRWMYEQGRLAERDPRTSRAAPVAPAPQPSAPSAMQMLTAALKADSEYAWSWHCNLAMPIMDHAQASHRVANIAAARLMQHLFGIDTEQHSHFQVDEAPAPLQQGEYLPLPEPDTHCCDDDTGIDVWSYSADLVRKVIDSDRAMRTAPQGDVAAWLVLADGEPHHVTPGKSDEAARLWAEEQTKCGAPYSFTFLPLSPPATQPQPAAPQGDGDMLRAHAEGRVTHINNGLCPDIIEGHDTRDPECPVCQALLENHVALPAPTQGAAGALLAEIKERAK